jgi:hypothetical protein
MGKEVEAGWHHGSPVPFIEVKEIKADGKTIKCRIYRIKLLVGTADVILGIFRLLSFKG